MTSKRTEDKDNKLARELQSAIAASDHGLRSARSKKSLDIKTDPESESSVSAGKPSTSSVVEPSSTPLTSVPLVQPHTEIKVIPNTSPLPISQIGQIMASPSAIKIDTKFCGNIVGTDKDIERYKHYTVQRWLTDSENRIASKNITSETDKIREARLAVHPEVGDAAAVINSVEMLEVVTWDKFKSKCLLLWRSQSEQDTYLALSKLLSVPYHQNPGDVISDLSKSSHDVISDIISKGKMKVGKASEWESDRPSELLVSLKEVFLHLNVGIIFNNLPPEHKKVFRKVDWLYNDGLVEILSKFSEQLAKSKSSVSNAA